MDKTVSFLLFLSLYVLTLGTEETSEQKRLLLSDPQTMYTMIHTLEAKLQALNDTVNAMKRTANSGATYIRWGSKTCPTKNGTILVYTGIAGGGVYSETGSAVNHVCLPHDPEFVAESAMANINGLTGLLYGTEYEVSFATAKLNDDVPCAVCKVTSSGSAIMIPAKTTCPVGWNKEYDGYLCSGYHGHSAATEYICVDKMPEYFEGRRNNNDGNVIYGVRTVCGTLPCPPYENNRLLPCVVCSS